VEEIRTLVCAMAAAGTIGAADSAPTKLRRDTGLMHSLPGLYRCFDLTRIERSKQSRQVSREIMLISTA
jgi:hypothetical protein